jgi:NAD(P)-dependent dehydrogenase (short-subunit alcohol dehydrogenase family)
VAKIKVYRSVNPGFELNTKGKAMKELAGKTAVITGAASGIGRALAVKLNQAGVHLALGDIDQNNLSETQGLLRRDSKISLHEVDVADRESMGRFAGEVMSAHGSVDILVNNAGITLTPTIFDDISEADFEKVINVNMWGVYLGIREFMPHLRSRPEAKIVNMSSLAGLVGLYGYTPYAMSKFAIRGLTESLQSELSGTNVSLLIVHPGGVKTNIIRNAPDLASDQQRQEAHMEFSRFAMISPEAAAGKIISAITKNKRQLVFGIDARIVTFIRGLFPGRFPSIVNAIFSQANFK